MKKLITMLIVLNLLLYVAPAFCQPTSGGLGSGSGGGSGSSEGKAVVSMVDVQNQSSNNIYSKTGSGTSESYSQSDITLEAQKYRTPPPMVNFVQPPYLFPQQGFAWNGLTSPDLYHERAWSLEEVVVPIKKVTQPAGPLEWVWGCVEGTLGLLFAGDSLDAKEVKVISTLSDYDSRPEYKGKFYTFIANGDIDRKSLKENYISIGMIHVKLGRGYNLDLAIRMAIEKAFDYDLDIGLILPGLSTINHGGSTASSGGAAHAGTVNAFSVMGGGVSSDAEVHFEPAVVMEVYRKGFANQVPQDVLDKVLLSSSTVRKTTGDAKKEKVQGSSKIKDFPAVKE